MSKRFKLHKLKGSLYSRKVLKASQLLMEDLDTPISLSTYLLVKYGEWNQIADREVNPINYNSSDDFRKDYQAVSFLRKYEDLQTTHDREGNALEKFLEAEEQCLRTNTNLRSRAWRVETPRRSEFLFRIQREISAILGPCPDLFDLDMSFGPGASLSCKGSYVSTYHKLSTLPEISLPAWHKAKSYIEMNRSLLDAYFINADIAGPFSIVGKHQIRIVNWNRLSFVPKTAKTDRAICVEPTLNTFFQKGIGNYIRNRLRLAGLDLSKQQKVNAKYAKIGSIDGSYATIDLSAASDTISAELISSVVDGEWFDLLDSFRCHNTQLPDGRIISNEKFSSMGNAFTFELETLLFYAIIRVIKKVNKTKGEVYAYGDDIIVPTEIAQETISVLEDFGFKTNLQKTFIAGNFRESCGMDFYKGDNVRPFFAKQNHDHFDGFISLANGIRHAAFRSLGSCDFSDPAYKRTWEFVVSQVPTKFRCFGPSWLGDQVLWAPRREAFELQRSQYHYHTVSIRGPKISHERFKAGVVLCGAALQTPSTVALRNRREFVVLTPFPRAIWDWWDGSWLTS